MHPTTILLACCLLGQTADKPFSPFVVNPDAPAQLPAVAREELDKAAPIAELRPPLTVTPPVATPAQHIEPIERGPVVAAPSGPVDRHATPPERIDEALTLPAQSRLSGRGIGLGAVLGSVASRPRQLEAVRAYWRLAETVGQYHFALMHDERLRQLSTAEGDPAALRVALAASSAACGEAEASAVAAQHELAALLPLPSDTPLPLPLDRPHVGSYRTHFDELFAMRTPPGKARQAAKTMPIRCRAIDDRAEAVGIAEDAIETAVADYRAGRIDVWGVLMSLSQCTTQRKALMASVCRYNVDIADYALAVTGPTVNGRALVSLLIRPGADTMQPLLPRHDPNIQRTGTHQPIGVPTLAPKPEKDTGAVPSEAVDRSPWVPSRPSDTDETSPSHPIFVEPPRESTGPTVPERPMVPVGVLPEPPGLAPLQEPRMPRR